MPTFLYHSRSTSVHTGSARKRALGVLYARSNPGDNTHSTHGRGCRRSQRNGSTCDSWGWSSTSEMPTKVLSTDPVRLRYFRMGNPLARSGGSPWQP